MEAMVDALDGEYHCALVLIPEDDGRMPSYIEHAIISNLTEVEGGYSFDVVDARYAVDGAIVELFAGSNE